MHSGWELPGAAPIDPTTQGADARSTALASSSNRLAQMSSQRAMPQVCSRQDVVYDLAAESILLLLLLHLVAWHR